MENDMEIEKIFKPKKNILIIGLIVLAVAIGLIVAGCVMNQNKHDNEKVYVYNDLISKDEDKEGALVELEIVGISPVFATKDGKSTKESFYFAIDKNNYCYIVRLTDETYKKLENQYNANPENFTYTFKGYIYDDPADLKRLAISAYNEILFEDAVKLTNSNFKDYLGKTYLDETKTPDDGTAMTLIGIGIGTTILSAIFLIISISQTTRLKSTLKKFDVEELKNELNNINIEEYKKQAIYLTDKYIISTINGLDVFDYKDILWVYNEKRKQNGILVGVWIMACTKDNKRIQIATAKKEDILVEIMTKIKEKNQDILIGFTGENNKEYKELVKKYKNGEI